MKTFTAHLKPDRPPILLRDGWRWGAVFFGPLWLLARRAWIPALLEAVAVVLLFTLAPAPFWRPALIGLAVINGLFGGDMVAWALARRGYAIRHVVLAPDHDAALLRLFTARPNLADPAR